MVVLDAAAGMLNFFGHDSLVGDFEALREMMLHPRTVLGLSDGGAHVDMFCDAGYATYLLGTWVRERAVMTLEHAVHRITEEPAKLFGIEKRGRIKPGMAADFAIFDLATVGSSKRGEMRIEGNLQPFMAHLQYFKDLLCLPRSRAR